MKYLISFFLLCFTVASHAEGLNEQAANPRVALTTSLGVVVIELDQSRAPVTVANFLSYVDDGSYVDTIFHRVIPGFMVQGGGHLIDLAEVPERDPIHNEADNGLSNVRGSIAMARMNEIDSARRQFFINTVNNERLDHHPKSCTREDEAEVRAAREKGLRKPLRCRSFGYAVFGRVVEGMDIVDLIEVVDTHSVATFDDVPVNPIVITAVERLPAAQ